MTDHYKIFENISFLFFCKTFNVFYILSISKILISSHFTI